MKVRNLIHNMLVKFFFLFVVSAAVVACDDDDDPVTPPTADQQKFKVTIENVSPSYKYFKYGVFNTPVGDAAAGPATPGKAYEFEFYAAEGHKLSFATMFVQSNDLFYAPDGMGIDLYTNGSAKEGDITSEIYLWDAGTEVNEEPGVGTNQAPRQTGPNTGTDENGTVRKISNVNDGFTYPMTSDVIMVSLDYLGNSKFKLKIDVLSSSTTPLAPGVFVVHSDANPLFTENSADMKYGLEAVAEDGNPATLSAYLMDNSGLGSPLAPGVFAVHSNSVMPLFEENAADKGEGLEALAEDGDPSTLSSNLNGKTGISVSGVFNTPVGDAAAGPLTPGKMYEFTFTAQKGDYLSFATMFVHSNDLFYALSESGLALWNGDTPVSGDVTSSLYLWDVGTEVNEFPGT
ncbi:MAG: spondin domain-containing protein [Rhodothermaceae bacterium]